MKQWQQSRGGKSICIAMRRRCGHARLQGVRLSRMEHQDPAEVQPDPRRLPRNRHQDAQHVHEEALRLGTFHLSAGKHWSYWASVRAGKHGRGALPFKAHYKASERLCPCKEVPEYLSQCSTCCTQQGTCQKGCVVGRSWLPLA